MNEQLVQEFNNIQTNNIDYDTFSDIMKEEHKPDYLVMHGLQVHHRLKHVVHRVDQLKQKAAITKHCLQQMLDSIHNNSSSSSIIPVDTYWELPPTTIEPEIPTIHNEDEFRQYLQDHVALTLPITINPTQASYKDSMLGPLGEVSSQEEYQDAKDLQRDQICINGTLHYGANGGYESIVDAVATVCMSESNTMTKDEAITFAKRILQVHTLLISLHLLHPYRLRIEHIREVSPTNTSINAIAYPTSVYFVQIPIKRSHCKYPSIWVPTNTIVKCSIDHPLHSVYVLVSAHIRRIFFAAK